MRVLIVEDEQVAARNLQRLLQASNPEIKVVAVLPSVTKAVAFLNEQPELDLIFLDIHLADGSVFELFEEIIPASPVVFTTAYDAYAVKAFELNSLDYLLKPISQERLRQTLIRYKEQQFSAGLPTLQKLDKLLNNLPKAEEYKNRFLLKAGSRLVPVEVSQIAYFYRDAEVVQLITKTEKRYPVNYSIEELEALLDPKLFIRLNRQVIASAAALLEIHHYFKGKLKVELLPPAPFDVIISQERASVFKQWLEEH